MLWKKCELLLQEDLDVATDWQSTAGELCWILKSYGSHCIVRWLFSTMQNCDFSQVYTSGTIWVIGLKFSMFYKAHSRHHKCVILGKIWSCLNYVDPKFNFYPSIMTSLGNYCNITAQTVVQNYRKGYVFRHLSANYCCVKQPEFPFLTFLKLKSIAPHILALRRAYIPGIIQQPCTV